MTIPMRSPEIVAMSAPQFSTILPTTQFVIAKTSTERTIKTKHENTEPEFRALPGLPFGPTWTS